VAAAATRLIRLHYIHDPLCGWCYAAAPLLAAAAALPHCELHLQGGALWARPTILPPPLRAQIRAADQRISAMTGQVFGREYHERLLMSDELVLDSRPVLAAVLAARTFGAHSQLRMLEAIQRANYVEARHVVRESTLLELAEELGLDRDRFREEFASAPVDVHVRATRGLMARTGTAGYPAAFVETADGTLRAVPPQESLGHPARFVHALEVAAGA
jgi:putative protein-disulfide isomerase